MNYSFLQCGEGALTVHLGDGIDPAINRRVTALQGAIGSAGLRGITDLIPAYADLTVCYDCTVISAKALQRQLRRLLDSLSVAGQDRRRLWAGFGLCLPPQRSVCAGSDCAAQCTGLFDLYAGLFARLCLFRGAGPSAAYAAAGQPTHLYSCGQCGNRRCADRGVPAGFSRRLAAAGAHAAGIIRSKT